MDFLTNTQRTFTWNTWNFWLRLFIVYFGLVPHIYVAGMPNTNRYRWQIFLCPAEICDTVFQVFSKAGSCWERTPTILARGIHQTFHLVLLCWSFRIVSCGNSDNNCLIFKAILENSLPGGFKLFHIERVHASFFPALLLNSPAAETVQLLTRTRNALIAAHTTHIYSLYILYIFIAYI